MKKSTSSNSIRVNFKLPLVVLNAFLVMWYLMVFFVSLNLILDFFYAFIPNSELVRELQFFAFSKGGDFGLFLINMWRSLLAGGLILLALIFKSKLKPYFFKSKNQSLVTPKIFKASLNLFLLLTYFVLFCLLISRLIFNLNDFNYYNTPGQIGRFFSRISSTLDRYHYGYYHMSNQFNPLFSIVMIIPILFALKQKRLFLK